MFLIKSQAGSSVGISRWLNKLHRLFQPIYEGALPQINHQEDSLRCAQLVSKAVYVVCVI